MIWQTMMGESKNPKQDWDDHNQKYQHFSCWTGSRKINRNRITKGDTLVVYWPGQSVYMGISVAAENGPYRLRLSEPEAPHNIDKWPYGLRICNLVKIAAVSDGVTLNKAQSMINNIVLPGRVGLRDASGWGGIDNLVDLIKNRARSVRNRTVLGESIGPRWQ